jgi:hypothetical protein
LARKPGSRCRRFTSPISDFTSSGQDSYEGFSRVSLVDNLWHLSSGRGANPGHSAPYSLYYGQGETSAGGGNYNTGKANAGQILSPIIDLGNVSGNVSLSFNYFLKTEADPTFTYDKAWVEISRDGGDFQSLIANNGLNHQGAWTDKSQDLNAYRGSKIQLKWAFDTTDPGYNIFEGWYVDDVLIQTSPTVITLTQDPANDIRFTSTVTNGSLGLSLTGVGDVVGDSGEDLAILRQGASASNAVVYLVRGKARNKFSGTSDIGVGSYNHISFSTTLPGYRLSPLGHITDNNRGNLAVTSATQSFLIYGNDLQNMGLRQNSWVRFLVFYRETSAVPTRSGSRHNEPESSEHRLAHRNTQTPVDSGEPVANCLA